MDETPKPKNKGGRPPKLSPLDDPLKSEVGPRASVRQRQAAALEATRKKWTVRQAMAAAGVTRSTFEGWLDDPTFAAAYDAAQLDFLDALEEVLIQQATGRAGRVVRASTQALSSFLATHSSAYSRSRADALLRQAGAVQDAVVRILRAHVPAEVVEQVEAELGRMREAIEGSGGTRVRS